MICDNLLAFHRPCDAMKLITEHRGAEDVLNHGLLKHKHNKNPEQRASIPSGFAGSDDKSYFKPLQANRRAQKAMAKGGAKSLFIITLNKLPCWILLNEINNFRKNAH
jgi:hypothetical protein